MLNDKDNPPTVNEVLEESEADPPCRDRGRRLECSQRVSGTVRDMSKGGGPMASMTKTEPQVRVLTDEEGQALFEAQVQELLGLTAADFLRRWHAGEYDAIADDPEHWDILYLAMLGVGGH